MERAPKILITGAGGMIGSYISFGTCFSKEELDVTDLSQIEKVFKMEKPAVVIHLAALTDMKKCEENQDLAYRINIVGTYNVALTAKEIGARLIYVSTNAVFDGEKRGGYQPTDIPHPVSMYGHTKYMGELVVLEMNPSNLVVRTSWVFGGGPKLDKKFVSKIIPKLRANEAFSAVDDVKGTPTYAKDFSTALEKLAINDTAGVIHLTNAGIASRYDMSLVLKEATSSKSDISAAPLSSFGDTGNALRNEILDPGRYAMRPWQEALVEYIKSEWK